MRRHGLTSREREPTGYLLVYAERQLGVVLIHPLPSFLAHVVCLFPSPSGASDIPFLLVAPFFHGIISITQYSNTHASFSMYCHSIRYAVALLYARIS
jgi:hypothetical protein